MLLFVKVLIVATPLYIWYLVIDHYMSVYTREYLAQVKSRFIPSNSDSESESDESGSPTTTPSSKPPIVQVIPSLTSTTNRLYLITGGSGFIGSWIARYLLLRAGENAGEGANILILDSRPPPSDLTKHGARFEKLNIADSSELKSVVEKELNATSKYDDVVVYHCAGVVKYHHADDGSLQSALTDYNIKLAQSLLNVFSMNSDIRIPVAIINFSDIVCYKRAVNWLKFWDRTTWLQTMPDGINTLKPREFVSNYARSKYEATELLHETTTTTTGNLRVSTLIPGHYVSGHLNDLFLSPVIYYGGGLMHNGSVPINLVHVEDVVQAALRLENLLTSDSDYISVIGQKFIIANETNVTTVEYIYNKIAKLRPFKIIKNSPGLVAGVSWLMYTFLHMYQRIIRSRLITTSKRLDSPLSGTPITYTPARFNTLQIGQVISVSDIRHAQEVLGYTPMYSVDDIIESVVEEHKFQLDKKGQSYY